MKNLSLIHIEGRGKGYKVFVKKYSKHGCLNICVGSSLLFDIFLDKLKKPLLAVSR